MHSQHLRLASLLFLAASATASQGDLSCPNNCEPNGNCVNGRCECDSGFAGADCSFPFQTCPDGILTCFDGAECTRLSLRNDDSARSQYECDCSTISEASPFQIKECNSPESQACVTGQDTSDYAFCTNGGRCINMVNNGEPHAGCICPKEFEGRHCQYRKGTAPDAELKIAHEEMEHHIEGFFFFLIFAIVGSVVGGFGYMVYLMKLKTDGIAKALDETFDEIELEENDTIEEEGPKGEMA